MPYIYGGCAGGGGGGGNQGTTPSISSVLLFKMVAGAPVETLTFEIGDEFNINVFATDPDLDMHTLYASQYLFPDLNSPYFPIAEFIMPTQTDTNMVYFLITNSEVVGPAGDWRICFYIVDEAGNESDDFCVNAVINGPAAPAAAVPPANLSLGLASEGEGAFGFANQTIDGEVAD